jgi:hypothetical protein
MALPVCGAMALLVALASPTTAHGGSVSIVHDAASAQDEVVRITRPLYRDMRLTHYNHNSFVANEKSLFHPALVRDEVAAEVAIARAARKGE